LIAAVIGAGGLTACGGGGSGSDPGRASTSRQIANGISPLEAAHSYTGDLSYRFALRDPGLPAADQRILAQVFPPSEQEHEVFDNGTRTLDVHGPGWSRTGSRVRRCRW